MKRHFMVDDTFRIRKQPKIDYENLVVDEAGCVVNNHHIIDEAKSPTAVDKEMAACQ
jgi:hypothetical protein